MLGNRTFKNIAIVTLITTLLLLTVLSLVYILRKNQLPDHQRIMEKVNNIKAKDLSSLKELIVIAEEYEINVLEVERGCGEWCGKYYDSEGDYEEWENCSQLCDVDKLEKLIRNEVYNRIERINNWWDIKSNIKIVKDSIKGYRLFFETYKNDALQKINDNREYQRLEMIAKQEILKFRKDLKKTIAEALDSGVEVNRDRIFQICNDGIISRYKDTDSLQAKSFAIKCEIIHYVDALSRHNN